MQDVGLMFHVSRAMMSAAQELRCLQEINATLQLLLAHDLPAMHCTKLDVERCRALFLLYCGRLRRAMMSPKYCYFSGFAAAAPRLLSQLKDLVLQTNCRPAGPRAVALLRQLDLWTLCCELSVAASVHDCFDHGLKHRLVERLQQSDNCNS
ncbi:hypothetical protein COO60DRAFT_1010901 [Scenedesmus sp. NREL 46B-D3]|nr:hypothetical protein COO60DRAFT_1010901 [Scenedesmus sp. NREL 46B-D3]